MQNRSSLLLIYVVVWMGAICPSAYDTVRTKLQAIVQERPNMHIGCQVHDLRNGQDIYTHDVDKRFTPASVTKVATALWALHELGIDFRYTSRLLSDGHIADGTLQGNLYLVGAGDPSLRAADVCALFGVLPDLGVSRWQGDLYVDASCFDTVFYAPGACVDDIGESWNNLIAGLMIDGKPAVPVAPTVSSYDLLKPDLFYAIKPAVINCMAACGVDWQGDCMAGTAPGQAQVLAVHVSPALPRLLARVLKHTDNLYSDCLFKTLGARTSGQPGSWRRASEGIKAFLHKEVGIPTTEVKLSDGSGRSRYNLLSPAQVVGMLTWAHRQPFFPQFREALAYAGSEGSLEKRMLECAPYVQGKTGSLGNVSGLCGYIGDEQPLAFAVFNNGFVSSSVYNPPCKLEVEDAVVRACFELVNPDDAH